MPFIVASRDSRSIFDSGLTCSCDRSASLSLSKDVGSVIHTVASSHVRTGHVGARHVGAMESRADQVGGTEIGIAQHRALEMRMRQRGALQLGIGKIGKLQLRAVEVGAFEAGNKEVRPLRLNASGEIRLAQVRIPKIQCLRAPQSATRAPSRWGVL